MTSPTNDTSGLPSWMTDDPEMMARINEHRADCVQAPMFADDATMRNLVDQLSRVVGARARAVPLTRRQRLRMALRRAVRNHGTREIRIPKTRAALWATIDLTTFMVGVTFYRRGVHLALGPLSLHFDEIRTDDKDY